MILYFAWLLFLPVIFYSLDLSLVHFKLKDLFFSKGKTLLSISGVVCDSWVGSA